MSRDREISRKVVNPSDGRSLGGLDKLRPSQGQQSGQGQSSGSSNQSGGSGGSGGGNQSSGSQSSKK